MKEIRKRIGCRREGMTIAMFLALLSSAGSILIAGVGGWQRGTVQVDQVLFAGVNILAALAAQFLPAVAARITALKRAACVGLWLVCMASTGLTHAWFLLAAQERAGEARAEAFTLAKGAPAPANRDRFAILSDRAGVSAQLARRPIRVCDGTCADRERFRRAALEDRLAALDAEAQAAADARQSGLRLQEQRQKAKEDLVGAQLAGSLGVSYSTSTWIMALTYALILEGVGCLCWAVVLRVETRTAFFPAADCRHADTVKPFASTLLDGRAESNVLKPASVTESPLSNEGESESNAPLSQPLRDDIARVTVAVHDSTIRLTVLEVRRLLRCSQAYAQQIRRLIPDSPAAARGPAD